MWESIHKKKLGYLDLLRELVEKNLSDVRFTALTRDEIIAIATLALSSSDPNEVKKGAAVLQYSSTESAIWAIMKLGAEHKKYADMVHVMLTYEPPGTDCEKLRTLQLIWKATEWLNKAEKKILDDAIMLSPESCKENQQD